MGGGKKKSNDSTDSSAESSIMDDSSGSTSADGLSHQLTQISVSKPVIVEEDTTIQVVSSITGSETNTTTEEKVAPVVCVPSAGDVETSLVSSIPSEGSTATGAPVLSFASGSYGGGLPPLPCLGLTPLAGSSGAEHPLPGLPGIPSGG